jgi:hypothetical protein
LKKNSIGYPSAMFLGDTCARNAKELANLFLPKCLCASQFARRFFCRRRDGVEDSSTVLLVQLEEKTVEQDILASDTQKGSEPDGISPLILKKIVLDVKTPFAVLYLFICRI